MTEGGQDLEAWLSGRSLPTSTVPLATDATAYATAEAEVAEAARALLEEQGSGQIDVEAERQRLTAARRRLADIPVRLIELRALEPTAWEVLVSAHPPSEEAAAKGWDWDLASFRPALVADSIVTPDGQAPLTREKLAAALEAGRMTIGELNRLYEEALTLNHRAPRASTGKG